MKLLLYEWNELKGPEIRAEQLNRGIIGKLTDCTFQGKLLTNIRNRTGPRMEPCGTSFKIKTAEEK